MDNCYLNISLLLDPQDRPLITISLFVLFRVKFETQQAANEEEIPLVTAAKTVFDSSDPSFWSLSALVVPRPLLPVIKVLARKFPSKAMQKSQNAFETLYDASNALIEVSLQILTSRSLNTTAYYSVLMQCYSNCSSYREGVIIAMLCTMHDPHYCTTERM